MSLEEKFMILYMEYADLIREREKNTRSVKRLILRLDFDDSLMRHFDKILFVIRSLTISLKFHIKDSEVRHAAHILKCYEKLLNLAANNTDLTRYLSIVNLFSSKNDLENCISVFTAPEMADDVRRCLHTISDNLVKVADNSLGTLDVKNLYLTLSRAILIFIRFETAIASTACGSEREFSETRYFLEKCRQLKCFTDGNDTEQYLICFDTLQLYLRLLETDTSFEENLDELRKQVEYFLSSKAIRATLVMDTAVTISEFVNISQKILIELITEQNFKDLLSFVYRIVEILRSTKYTKTFCIKCENSVGIHQIDAITTVAVHLYKKSIQENFCSESITEVFAKIFAHRIMSVSLLVCDYTRAIQNNALVALNDIIALCPTAGKTAFVIPVLQELLVTYRKTKLSELSFEYNEVYLLRKLLDLLKINNDYKEMIRVSFLAMIYLIHQKADNSTTLHNLAYTACTLQNTHKDKIKFFTPFNYLTEKGEKFYGLKLPSNLDNVDILVNYLKLANLYITFPIDFNNKIIDQILKLCAGSTMPEKYLRFAYHTDNFAYDTFHERIQAELNRVNFNRKNGEYIQNRLIVGTFKFMEYSHELLANAAKYKHISVSEEISRKQSSVFEEQNLKFEIKHYNMLLCAKESFINFIDYYLQLKESERDRYGDEMLCLLSRTKILARNFTMRDYPTDAIELYDSLFKLAKEKKDDFGIISACSYFAEYSNDFQTHFKGTMDLSKILEQCYTLLVKHLENLTKLSLRKQNEVFYCLLNIAVYYLNINRINDAKKLLQFVHLKIGPCEMVTKSSKKSSKNDSGDASKMQYEAVRVKYYSVLFSMIIKHKQNSSFSLVNFAEFILYYIRANIHMTADDTINVPNILFNTIPAIVMCGLNRYDLNELGESLLSVLLKFSIRTGLVRRSIKTLIMIILAQLYSENCKGCEDKIGLLENIFLMNNPSPMDDVKEKLISDTTIDSSLISDPIRKEGTTIKFLSPYKTITNDRESYTCRYLTKHPSNCECAICQTPSHQLFLFQMSCLHMRLIYLNDTDVQQTSTECNDVYQHWTKELKQSQLVTSDEFLIFSVKMLMWQSHHLWRHKSNLSLAEHLMVKAHKWFQKIPNYDCALEEDILAQISELKRLNTADNTDKPPAVLALNHKKNFHLEVDRTPAIISSSKKIVSSTNKSNVRNDVAIRRIDLIEFTAKTTGFKIFDENEKGKSSNKDQMKNGTKDPNETKLLNKQIKLIKNDSDVIVIDSSPELESANANNENAVVEKKKTVQKRAPKEKMISEACDENLLQNPNQMPTEVTTPRVTRSKRIKPSK